MRLSESQGSKAWPNKTGNLSTVQSTKSESSTSTHSRSVTQLSTRLMKLTVLPGTWNFRSRLNSSHSNNHWSCATSTVICRSMILKNQLKTPSCTSASLHWVTTEKSMRSILCLGTGPMERYLWVWSRSFIPKSWSLLRSISLELSPTLAQEHSLLLRRSSEVWLRNRHSRPLQESTCPSISISLQSSVKLYHHCHKLTLRLKLFWSNWTTQNQKKAEVRVSEEF